MDSINLSPANQAFIQQKQQETTAQIQTEPKVEQKKNGKKLLITGAAAVATIAIASIMIYKGKAPKKLADIQFDGGKAKKGEKLFTGAIEDTLKNGNKIKLEYKDGVIQKAITETDGKKVVKEYVDGVISKKDGKTVDIKKIQEEVKLNQEKLKKLLKDDTLSSEELTKQADKIKYKSKNQQKEIEKIVDSKAQKEAQLAKEAQEKAAKTAKEAQEKVTKKAQEQAAQEAQEKALKAQKEAQERAAKEAQEAAKEARKKAQLETKKILKQIEQQEEKAKAEFIEQIKSSIPDTYEERYEVLIKEGYPVNIARTYAKSVENYEEFLWHHTSEFKKFNYDKIRAKMDEKEIIKFNNAKKILEANNIQYTEEELLGCSEMWQSLFPFTTINTDDSCAFHTYPYTVNHFIRNGKYNPKDDLYLRVLDKAFETVKPLENDEVVFRGIQKFSQDDSFVKKITSMKKGEIFTDSGYSYSSFDEKIAKSFVHDGCLLEIRVPKGAKVSSARYSAQSEMLFPRNAQFKVLEEALQTEDGERKMILEYILP